MRWLARRSSAPVTDTAGACARDDDGAPSADGELPREAERFIALFHAETPQAGPVGVRMRQVLAEVTTDGTYRHTPLELAFGARVAWRNSARCIGRLYWRSLRVRDLRHVGDAAVVAAECAAHLRIATGNGKIRPLISVFAPDVPGRPGPRIYNEQLIRYAGYREAGGEL